MRLDDDKYPNGTLKNLLHITDADQLRHIEYTHTAMRAADLLRRLPRITRSRQLIDIHRYLFEDLYSWAGVVRDYELSKGKTQFIFSAELSHGFDYIDNLLAKLPDGPLTAENYAQLLDSLNYLHPFREGNGRSARLFLQLIGKQHLQDIDYPDHTDELIQAEIDADIPALAKLITVEAVHISSTVEKILGEYLTDTVSSRRAPLQA